MPYFEIKIYRVSGMVIRGMPGENLEEALVKAKKSFEEEALQPDWQEPDRETIAVGYKGIGGG